MLFCRFRSQKSSRSRVSVPGSRSFDAGRGVARPRPGRVSRWATEPLGSSCCWGPFPGTTAWPGQGDKRLPAGPNSRSSACAVPAAPRVRPAPRRRRSLGQSPVRRGRGARSRGGASLGRRRPRGPRRACGGVREPSQRPSVPASPLLVGAQDAPGPTGGLSGQKATPGEGSNFAVTSASLLYSVPRDKPTVTAGSPWPSRRNGDNRVTSRSAPVTFQGRHPAAQSGVVNAGRGVGRF